MSFIPEIELADLQAVESAIEEKIRYYKANYPDDRMAITDMRNALQVLYDLEEDLDADDLEEEGKIYYYTVDYVDGYSIWGVVCEKSAEEARQLIRMAYECDDDELRDVEIDKIVITDYDDDDVDNFKMFIGDIMQTGQGWVD